MQYIYWEKVHPRSGPIFDPLKSTYPLMKNWTQLKALERYDYDTVHGRGHGDVSSLFH